MIFRKNKSKTQESSTTRQESREEAFRDEYQNNSEGAEIGHYATVQSLSPSKPTVVKKEPTSEIQYETLGFKETADLRNDNGQFPLNIL